MIERANGSRRTVSVRVAVTSLLVASGVGLVGVVPALAANHSPAPAAVKTDHGRDHDRWFRDRGDVRYVWYKVCEGTAPGTTTTATTTGTTTTEAAAAEALAAAVEGAATDTTTETTTTETTTTTTSADDSDDEAYPMFVVVPLSKDEAKKVRKLDERPCYDLTTGAPETITGTTTTDTTTTDPTTTTTETTPATTTG